MNEQLDGKRVAILTANEGVEEIAEGRHSGQVA
jgi:hypothetical protein